MHCIGQLKIESQPLANLHVKFTGVCGLHDTSLVMHNRQSEEVNLVQFVAVTVDWWRRNMWGCVQLWLAGCVTVSSLANDIPGQGSFRWEVYALSPPTAMQTPVHCIYLPAA